MTRESDNAGSCPLCGQGNNCGNLTGLAEGSCWCSKAYFPREIFERISADQLNKSCICKSCLEKYSRT